MARQIYEDPRGWEIPTNGKKLQVGVVTGNKYQKYIDVVEDSITGVIKASGIAIDVFEEAVKRLPYALPYEYVVFNIAKNSSSSYDDFVNQVYLKVRIYWFSFQVETIISRIMLHKI